MCTDSNGKATNTTAYSWSDIGWFWDAQYIVFCPLFFSDQLTSLASKVETAQGDIYMQTTIDYWRPIRARTMLYETYHWEEMVSNPVCIAIPTTPMKFLGSLWMTRYSPSFLSSILHKS
jgi:hypothetical protein